MFGRRPGGAGLRQRGTTVAVALVVLALISYNWWVLVPFRPGLLESPDELFSNLEVTGQPYASAMHIADLVSGTALLAALLLLRSKWPAPRLGEWWGLVVFAISGALGGLFSEVCADEVSSTCRSMEWRLELPVPHYVHMLSGIVEFAAITLSLLLARRRTSGGGAMRSTYRALSWALVIGYPILGYAYLADRWGAVAESYFFAVFTIVVVTLVAESRTEARPAVPDGPQVVRDVRRR